MRVGVDFSINSPGVTIRNADNKLHFYAFPRVGSVKEDCLISLRLAGVNVSVLDGANSLPAKATIAQRERNSLTDAIMEATAISKQIKLAANKDKDLYLAIEGFSFGSTGNRLAQISGYQYLFRYVLHQNNKLNLDHFHTYSPMTVKATAGKGNFKKADMIAAFLASQEESLLETGLWKAMTADPTQFQTKRGNWLSPIDDIIDSYYVLKTMENNLEL